MCWAGSVGTAAASDASNHSLIPVACVEECCVRVLVGWVHGGFFFVYGWCGGMGG